MAVILQAQSRIFHGPYQLLRCTQTLLSFICTYALFGCNFKVCLLNAAWNQFLKIKSVFFTGRFYSWCNVCVFSDSVGYFNCRNELKKI